MSPEALLERKRAIDREAQRRIRKKTTKDERRAKRIQDEARCFDWARILPHVDKRPDGCWIWLGSFQAGFKVRPVVRAGTSGKVDAAQVVWCLHNKQPIPHGCFLSRRCANITCIAPEHLVLTNRSVERAKARLSHGEEQAVRGERPGAGDHGAGAGSD